MFEIDLGEIVGFFGFNGVGKIIILKMLIGLIYLFNGVVKVVDYIFFECKREFL